MMQGQTPKFAPKPGCPCDVCFWARTGFRSRFQARELRDNYRRYQNGELLVDLIRETQNA
jgi:hypothetical protein